MRPGALLAVGGSLRIGAISVVVWLAIGVVAVAQRDYLSNAKTSCAEVNDTVVTMAAGR
jgi:hypothetical protein